MSMPHQRHQRHQSPTERRYHTDTNMSTRALNCSGIPALVWLLCMMFICFVPHNTYSATLGQVPIQQATGSTIDYHPSTPDKLNPRIDTSEGETSSKSGNNDLDFGSDAIDPNLEQDTSGSNVVQLQVALVTPGWIQRRYLDNGAIFWEWLDATPSP